MNFLCLFLAAVIAGQTIPGHLKASSEVSGVTVEKVDQRDGKFSLLIHNSTKKTIRVFEIAICNGACQDGNYLTGRFMANASSWSDDYESAHVSEIILRRIQTVEESR